VKLCTLHALSKHDDDVHSLVTHHDQTPEQSRDYHTLQYTQYQDSKDSGYVDNWLHTLSQGIVRNMHFAVQRTLRMSTA